MKKEQSHLSEYQREMLKDITDTLDNSYKELVLDEPNPSMRESIFAGYFLPRIIGEVVDPDRAWISRWLLAVRSVTRYIDIYQDRTGEYLYTVPPLLSTENLSKVRLGTVLPNMFLECDARRNTGIPEHGESYLRNILGATGKHYEQVSVDQEQLLAWRNILLRYNKIEGPKEEANEETAPGGLGDWLDL